MGAATREQARRPGKMSAMSHPSPGSPKIPSIEEHQADLGATRVQVAQYRERNAELENLMKKVKKKSVLQTDQFFGLKANLVDLEDRKKFIVVAGCKNPSPIGQYSPNLKGPPPHDWYQRQIAMVRNSTTRLISAEDAKASAPKVDSDFKEPDTFSDAPHRVRPNPHNYSPWQGLTLNHVRRQTDP